MLHQAGGERADRRGRRDATRAGPRQPAPAEAGGTTGQPVTDAVKPSDMAALRELNTSLQGRTAKLRNPFDETSLAWYTWIVARLGGWSGYTSRGYRPPGPKTMHRGMIIVEQILTGWRLAIRAHSGDRERPIRSVGGS